VSSDVVGLFGDTRRDWPSFQLQKKPRQCALPYRAETMNGTWAITKSVPKCWPQAQADNAGKKATKCFHTKDIRSCVWCSGAVQGVCRVTERVGHPLGEMPSSRVLDRILHLRCSRFSLQWSLCNLLMIVITQNTLVLLSVPCVKLAAGVLTRSFQHQAFEPADTLVGDMLLLRHFFSFGGLRHVRHVASFEKDACSRQFIICHTRPKRFQLLFMSVPTMTAM